MVRAPVLTAPMVGMRNALNARFPKRDHTSDGWIGNRAHQLEVSGHNPDDTPGVRAERSDPDNIPEVRGLDTDKDLRDTETAEHRKCVMDDVVNAILSDSVGRKTLIYVIWNRRIWEKSNGWHARTYHGKNPHTEHMHASGDPAYDATPYSWPTIRNLGAKPKTTPVGKDDEVILVQLKGTTAIFQVHCDRNGRFRDHVRNPDELRSMGKTYADAIVVSDLGPYGPVVGTDPLNGRTK